VSEPSVDAAEAVDDGPATWRPGDPDRRTDADRRADRAGQQPGDLGIALTPSQIFGGFALLAAIVVLLRRRNHGDPKG
jgi:hypothetical protein